MEGEGTKGPSNLDLSEYHLLSEYTPGADIKYELEWDGHRLVGKVPKWAHEEWLQNPKGAKSPCENHPKSSSATADAAASGTQAPKCHGKDFAKVPSETVAGYDTKAPKHHWKDVVEIPSETADAYAEVIALDPALAYAYPDVYAYHRDPERYALVEEGGRVVLKLDKWAGPRKPPCIGSSDKSEGGFSHPKPLKEDPSAGAKYETKPKGNL